MSTKPIVAECSQDLFSTEDTIQQASYAGNLALVQIMRKKGATITDVDLDGRTAIHWAACGGHAHLLQHFYTENENGFQKVINNPDDAGWTPLHSAVGSGHANVVNVLLETGADPNATTKQDRTPLHYVKGRGDIAKLITQRASKECLNARDEVGSTALCRAATLGHLDVVACLVEAGASINLGNASGNSPLHLACYESHKEIAILLLKKGASEDTVNKAGKRPVEMASGELKKELIEA
jgi:ankyrin repeat protein